MKANPKQGKKKKKRRKFIPKAIVTAVFERDTFTCQYCGDQHIRDSHSLHCHHIIRTSQGGETTINNLNACCWICHYDHGEISKIDKLWLEGKHIYKGGRKSLKSN